MAGPRLEPSARPRNALTFGHGQAVTESLGDIVFFRLAISTAKTVYKTNKQQIMVFVTVRVSLLCTHI